VTQRKGFTYFRRARSLDGIPSVLQHFFRQNPPDLAWHLSQATEVDGGCFVAAPADEVRELGRRLSQPEARRGPKSRDHWSMALLYWEGFALRCEDSDGVAFVRGAAPEYAKVSDGSIKRYARPYRVAAFDALQAGAGVSGRMTRATLTRAREYLRKKSPRG
jgi:hypothetical protein